MNVRFPSPELRVEPENLRLAVHRLGRDAQEPPVPKDVVSVVVQKLRRSASPDLTSRELRALPFVAAEHDDLETAVVRIAGESITQLRWYTIRSLLELLPGAGPLVARATRRAAMDPPKYGPAWLRELEPTSDLALLLARKAVARNLRLAEAFGEQGLHLDQSCPLGRQVGLTMVRHGDDAWIRPQVAELLDLVDRRAAPPDLQHACLVRTMDLCTGQVHFPADVAGGWPVRWLEAAAAWAQGWPADSPGPWSRLPGRAAEFARWYLFSRDLEEFFGSAGGNAERKRYWRGWIHRVKDHMYFKQADALAMQIGEYWIVEFLQHGNASYVYHRARWPAIRPSPSTSNPSVLKDRSAATTRLIHQAPWQSRFDHALAQLGCRR